MAGWVQIYVRKNLKHILHFNARAGVKTSSAIGLAEAMLKLKCTIIKSDTAPSISLPENPRCFQCWSAIPKNHLESHLTII